MISIVFLLEILDFRYYRSPEYLYYSFVKYRFQDGSVVTFSLSLGALTAGVGLHGSSGNRAVSLSTISRF